MEASEVANRAPAVSVETVGQRIGRYRWVICALLFFATTVNYVDRQVLGILSKDLKDAIGWTEVDYGNIVAAFSAAYAFGLLLAGRLMDRIGTRAGYAWHRSGGVWRRWAMHWPARLLVSVWPARRWESAKRETFPLRSKQLPNGFRRKSARLRPALFNAGSNVGAIVAPLTCRGSRATGVGKSLYSHRRDWTLWWLFWLPLYRRPEEHPKVSRAELDTFKAIHPILRQPRVPWCDSIPHRQTSAFAIGKYLTDPVWWFYLYWIPTSSATIRAQPAPNRLASGHYLCNRDIGSIGGGWLSSTFIKRGWTVNRCAQDGDADLCDCCYADHLRIHVKNIWGAAVLIGFAAAAHQGWSCNLFTTTSDMFPRNAVGSVVGLGGMAGALGWCDDGSRDRLHSPDHGKELLDRVHDRRNAVSDRPGVDALAGAATRSRRRCRPCAGTNVFGGHVCWVWFCRSHFRFVCGLVCGG
jgi:ACS family hexuronate transporter-like MFS transporter